MRVTGSRDYSRSLRTAIPGYSSSVRTAILGGSKNGAIADQADRVSGLAPRIVDRADNVSGPAPRIDVVATIGEVYDEAIVTTMAGVQLDEIADVTVA